MNKIHTYQLKTIEVLIQGSTIIKEGLLSHFALKKLSDINAHDYNEALDIINFMQKQYITHESVEELTEQIW